MIYEFNYSVNYRDADASRYLRIDALVSLLQESAILHSELIGFDADYMYKHSCAWMLNKFAIVIYEYPFLRDQITIKTWSRGLKSFRAFRDFEVFKGDKLIAHATSYWFFIDTTKKRVIKVPEEVQKMYGYHDITTGVIIDDSEPTNIDDFFFEKNHIIRYSDIDSNGHLNNVAYLNMLEDTIKNSGTNSRIKEYYISFKKEIVYDSNEISVSILKATEKRYFFYFNKDAEIYAQGVVNLY
ncbi:MAG: thioesterase [Calditerrivibrio sp.]|nr:thioesterase [Calditerrivibrio sp.]